MTAKRKPLRSHPFKDRGDGHCGIPMPVERTNLHTNVTVVDWLDCYFGLEDHPPITTDNVDSAEHENALTLLRSALKALLDSEGNEELIREIAGYLEESGPIRNEG